MKLTQILLLIAIVSYVTCAVDAVCTADGTECGANECCASLKCASMLTNSVYTQTRTAASGAGSQTCLAIGTKCAKTDTYLADTPAAALCIDATTKQCRVVAANYAYGIKAAADFTCVEVVAKQICVDGSTKVAKNVTAQTGTDYTAVYCIHATTKACTALQATAGTWDNGFLAADDFTCAPTTNTANCVDPSTLLLGTATASTTYCSTTTKKQCEALTYANTLPRYTREADFTCKLTTTATGLCNSATCKLSECCESNACVAASATKCLTSATAIACTPIASSVYSVKGDASCVATSTLTAKTQCYDSTTKVIATLTSASTSCVNTDSVCANLKDTAGTAQYTHTDTATSDFTCKAVATTTTTTTTTTTSSQIINIIGSIIILISYILI